MKFLVVLALFVVAAYAQHEEPVHHHQDPAAASLDPIHVVRDPESVERARRQGE
jgi:hypothetical protein